MDFEPKYDPYDPDDEESMSEREQSLFVEDRLDEIAKKFNVYDFEQFFGCPACGPYITALSHEESEVRRLYDAIYKFIKIELGWVVTS
jgi:hypothetical protein